MSDKLGGCYLVLCVIHLAPKEPYYLWQYTRRHSLAPLTLATKLATLLSSP